MIQKLSQCPRCGRLTGADDLVLALDNKTDVCPECRARESMTQLGIPPEEITEILRTMKRFS